MSKVCLWFSNTLKTIWGKIPTTEYGALTACNTQNVFTLRRPSKVGVARKKKSSVRVAASFGITRDQSLPFTASSPSKHFRTLKKRSSRRLVSKSFIRRLPNDNMSGSVNLTARSCHIWHKNKLYKGCRCHKTPTSKSFATKSDVERKCGREEVEACPHCNNPNCACGPRCQCKRPKTASEACPQETSEKVCEVTDKVKTPTKSVLPEDCGDAAKEVYQNRYSIACDQDGCSFKPWPKPQVLDESVIANSGHENCESYPNRLSIACDHRGCTLKPWPKLQEHDKGVVHDSATNNSEYYLNRLSIACDHKGCTLKPWPKPPDHDKCVVHYSATKDTEYYSNRLSIACDHKGCTLKPWPHHDKCVGRYSATKDTECYSNRLSIACDHKGCTLKPWPKPQDHDNCVVRGSVSHDTQCYSNRLSLACDRKGCTLTSWPKPQASEGCICSYRGADKFDGPPDPGSCVAVNVKTEDEYYSNRLAIHCNQRGCTLQPWPKPDFLHCNVKSGGKCGTHTRNEDDGCCRTGCSTTSQAILRCSANTSKTHTKSLHYGKNLQNCTVATESKGQSYNRFLTQEFISNHKRKVKNRRNKCEFKDDCVQVHQESLCSFKNVVHFRETDSVKHPQPESTCKSCVPKSKKRNSAVSKDQEAKVPTTPLPEHKKYSTTTQKDSTKTPRQPPKPPVHREKREQNYVPSRPSWDRDKCPCLPCKPAWVKKDCKKQSPIKRGSVQKCRIMHEIGIGMKKQTCLPCGLCSTAKAVTTAGIRTKSYSESQTCGKRNERFQPSPTRQWYTKQADSQHNRGFRKTNTKEKQKAFCGLQSFITNTNIKKQSHCQLLPNSSENAIKSNHQYSHDSLGQLIKQSATIWECNVCAIPRRDDWKSSEFPIITRPSCAEIRSISGFKENVNIKGCCAVANSAKLTSDTGIGTSAKTESTKEIGLNTSFVRVKKAEAISTQTSKTNRPLAICSSKVANKSEDSSQTSASCAEIQTISSFKEDVKVKGRCAVANSSKHTSDTGIGTSAKPESTKEIGLNTSFVRAKKAEAISTQTSKTNRSLAICSSQVANKSGDNSQSSPVNTTPPKQHNLFFTTNQSAPEESVKTLISSLHLTTETFSAPGMIRKSTGGISVAEDNDTLGNTSDVSSTSMALNMVNYYHGKKHIPACVSKVTKTSRVKSRQTRDSLATFFKNNAQFNICRLKQQPMTQETQVKKNSWSDKPKGSYMLWCGHLYPSINKMRSHMRSYKTFGATSATWRKRFAKLKMPIKSLCPKCKSSICPGPWSGCTAPDGIAKSVFYAGVKDHFIAKGANSCVLCTSSYKNIKPKWRSNSMKRTAGGKKSAESAVQTKNFNEANGKVGASPGTLVTHPPAVRSVGTFKAQSSVSIAHYTKGACHSNNLTVLPVLHCGEQVDNSPPVNAAAPNDCPMIPFSPVDSLNNTVSVQSNKQSPSTSTQDKDEASTSPYRNMYPPGLKPSSTKFPTCVSLQQPLRSARLFSTNSIGKKPRRFWIEPNYRKNKNPAVILPKLQPARRKASSTLFMPTRSASVKEDACASDIESAMSFKSTASHLSATKSEHEDCDLVEALNLLDKDKCEGDINAYCGDCYKNKLYHRYSDMTYYDLVSHLKKYQQKQPGDNRKN